MEILSRDYPQFYECIQMGRTFRSNTVETAYAIRNEQGKNEQQVELLKKLISANDKPSNLTNLNNGEGVPLPANLDYTLMSVRVEKAKVFTSATKPLLLPFYYRLPGDSQNRAETFTMMFKTGDDMRQDQLVLQLFQVMDNLLNEIGLDVEFQIYNLIAFTVDDGLLQFVPHSKTITDIIKEYDTAIEGYLKENTNGDQQLFEKKQNTYIKTCAAYSIATYLLGIGDRHLENLMIDRDGKFFHIDFGFIFGKEPSGKGSLASKIRISKKMVAAMGGPESEGYEKFERKCWECFKHLRARKAYILNLMHLMINSGISDLPFAMHQKVLNELYQRFWPDITNDEDAFKALKQLLKNCRTSTGAETIELFHNLAQYNK